MKPSPPLLLRFLGFNTQGDLGPYTLYTAKKHQLVIYLSTSPKEPPSRRQHHQRNFWRVLGMAWQTLPTIEKRNWEVLAKAANLRITGYNLYVYSVSRYDRTAVQTLMAQTGILVTWPSTLPA